MTAMALNRRYSLAPLVGLLSLVIFFVLIELLIRIGVVNRFIVPPPSEIIASFSRVILEED
ncbi:MAG: hypothetical protein WCI56_14660, partial [Hyphomicrobiales bacterium]